VIGFARPGRSRIVRCRTGGAGILPRKNVHHGRGARYLDPLPFFATRAGGPEYHKGRAVNIVGPVPRTPGS